MADKILDFQGTIQFRRAPSADWVIANPKLAQGEFGVEIDTRKFKIGDGTTLWNALPYGGMKGDTGLKGDKGDKGDTGDVTPAATAAKDAAVAAKTAAETAASTATQKATDAQAYSNSAYSNMQTAVTKAGEAAASATTAGTYATNAGSAATTATTKASDASNAAAAAASSAATLETAISQMVRKVNNLSDLDSATLARTNLSVYSKTETNQRSPTGMVALFPCTVPPSGWLELAGQILQRSQYPELWAFAQSSGNLVTEAVWGTSSWGCFSSGDGSTTFRIPQYCGEFVRAWDHGKGIDVGRAIGVWQGDLFKAHNHVADGRIMLAQLASSSFASGIAAGAAYSNVGMVTDNGGVVTSNTLIGNTGGTETRPRNISAMYCIKT